MKKVLILSFCLALILSLFCGCKDESVTPEIGSSEEEVEAFDISSVTIDELPTEMLSEDLSNWDYFNLIAELPDEKVSLYGLSANDDGTGVIFRKNDDLYYYNWAWFTTQAKLPEIAMIDVDGDKQKEIAISLYVDYNTNVSIEELHIIAFESEKPVDKCFSSDLIENELFSKFDLRFETDEVEEEESSSSSSKSDESSTVSMSWLIDHTSDLGKRIIFEQKADEVKEGKKAKKYFTYDATRLIRENGEYNGIAGYKENVDYTLSSKNGISVKLKVAAAFKDSDKIKFICTISAPVTIKDGEFKLGTLKYSKI
ncbi:MAG: hypothetical protein IJO89_04845 [Clostridia bacterium]|nr:hypothetical protein [Clostridia bacterium]MBQ9958358.1 hypothetical protein [Clostridia bacterium]